jgi:signal transduction histidine kinase
MAPNTLAKMFEPFFTTKGHKGNGIGLWICRGIVDRHQGMLRVRSRQSRKHPGTVFALFLPFETVVRD